MILMTGTELANNIKEGLSAEVATFSHAPKLVVIQVGDNEASAKYIRMKQKACERVGIIFEHVHFEEKTLESDIINKIFGLNNDQNVNGIIVQLPLPNGFNTDRILESIEPIKDVDGLTIVNRDLLANADIGLYPATAEGVINLLRYYNVPMKGALAVVLGRSNLVGKPVVTLLAAEGANVTVCHSQTTDTRAKTLKADIIVSAVGKRNLLTAEMVKKGAAVIDVGMDVDFDGVSKVAGYLTPAIGGVGPMTVAMLLSNVVKAAKMQNTPPSS